MTKKIFIILYFFIFFNFSYIKAEASLLFDDNDDIVIVIDPGHGGDNLGTSSNPSFLEKDINLITANALIEELSKYEGVTIYSTRTDDVDLSLKERAEFAHSVNADFLFSLHYNASESHSMYGTEVWIPLYAPFHAPAYQFAYIQLQQMDDMGLFVRGIKTREGNNGKDYYGIIRESSELEIPSVIIEHCHIDAEQDKDFCTDVDKFIEFGKRDAQAIAIFLNLKDAGENIPEQLTNLTVESLIADTYIDKTIPNICQIKVESADYENGLLTLKVTGDDYDTALMYYDYSLDGGKTYSKLFEWPGSDTLHGTNDDSFSLKLEISENTKPRIILRAYNKFDLFKESNILTEFETFRPILEEDSERYAFLSVYENPEEEIVQVDNKTSTAETLSLFGAPFTFKRFLLLFGFSIFWVLLLVSGLRIIWRTGKK